MPEKTYTCAHDGCKCGVAEKGAYCGHYCRDGGDIAETGCGCEHMPCRDQLRVAPEDFEYQS